MLLILCVSLMHVLLQPVALAYLFGVSGDF